ncbi:hypothetical protein DAPPUDRAFT_238866 [Daphnia pulex]|uniref:Uncharacterized protein n=1 Tax=Daphnia pulex TaxID=6669 RepID=E9G7M6_DAPPU|nr:hypothetical protein DAPPUDRAFT_238866 [Daphnia pulex]|eukprot:EFX84497.1 hypothetical protein DAPPUDRAFT_238866 [Daphnia pulex]
MPFMPNIPVPVLHRLMFVLPPLLPDLFNLFSISLNTLLNRPITFLNKIYTPYNNNPNKHDLSYNHHVSFYGSHKLIRVVSSSVKMMKKIDENNY